MKKYLLMLSLSLLFLSGRNVLGETANHLDNKSMPSLVSAIRVNGPVTFCGEAVPLDIPEIRERLEKELLLLLWDKPQVILWLKRTTRYFPYIEGTLAQNNMPEDLKYIAVAESALLSHAGSPKGAVGYWQFIKSTGLKYGLVIDRNFDERQNFYASTRAAIRYLKDLHELFGSWTLAAAAYNLGEANLQNEKTLQKVDNYYEFYLPQETQRYLFKIIAIKLVLSDPVSYGFQLQPEDYYPPEPFDRVKITLPNMTPLYLVAQAAGTYFKKIKDLNPEIIGHELPKGTHLIAVPKGTGETFHSHFADLAEKWRQEYQMHIYIVKEGDSLSTIAERFNISLPALLAWNDLSSNSYIHPGEKLVIYQ
jgi:membrane-bound lytic murein transglycosylase D